MEVICDVVKSGSVSYSDGLAETVISLVSGECIGGNDNFASSRPFDFELKFAIADEGEWPFEALVGKRVKVTLELVEDVG